MKRGRMELALARALRAVDTKPEDVGAVELARQHARAIDEGDLFHAGRALLDVLVELGMTPKARAAVVKAAPPAPVSGLDELRSRRERRA